jgi:cytochrome oxidase Cu insertion factor (SCO1/SenC/PrrC family)
MMAGDVEIRWRWLAAISVCALALGVLVGLLVFPNVRQQLIAGAGQMGNDTARIGGPFELVTHAGQRVSDRDFRGRPMLVTFGHSSDPDLTPARLQTLAAVLDRLGAKADRLAVVFITVDPVRDTPKVLADYLARFHPRLLGLTGTPDKIAAVAKAYKVVGTNSGNIATHGDKVPVYAPLIFLMNPKGNYVSHMGNDANIEAIIHVLGQLL